MMENYGNVSVPPLYTHLSFLKIQKKLKHGFECFISSQIGTCFTIFQSTMTTYQYQITDLVLSCDRASAIKVTIKCLPIHRNL